MKENAEIVRPWGGYSILKKSKIFWVKKLYVNVDARLSLQSHNQRYEVWYVLSGAIDAQVGNKIQHAQTGDVIYIPLKRKHRIIGVKDACVLEFAFGKVLEHDIIRYEDDYGRA